jgi:hypothetical protein
MQKQSGGNARRRPGFDSLEERSLLSGVIGWPAALVASSAGPSPHVGPGWLAGPVAGGGPFSHAAWTADGDRFGPAQQPAGGSTAEGPGGFGPAQGDGGPWFGSQDDAPFQSAGGFAGPANGPLAGGPSSQPGVFVAPFSGAPAAPSGSAAARGGEPVAGNQAFSGAENVAGGSNVIVITISAKESGQEPALAGLAPIGQAGAPPAQSSMVDANSAGRPLSLATGSDGPAGGAGGWSAGRAAPAHATLARFGDRSLFDRLTRPGDQEPDGLPGPSGADLIAAGLPLDQAALDRALDQFFRQRSEWGASDRSGRGPARFVLVSLALASSLVALEVVRRRFYRTSAGELRAQSQAREGGPFEFPERPRSWSSRLL